jgi:hypothetical protein
MATDKVLTCCVQKSKGGERARETPEGERRGLGPSLTRAASWGIDLFVAGDAAKRKVVEGECMN